ncbi:hypothetical protein [Jiella marina]|uniref:hypothetical protein n=1 Tax=Jiella sp. LLJ827 TaxID=2917712 RepID=UPI002100A09A|nr:hypothetical protein [Jiella sp. LLJ827]MCQ0986988.1 hypothetical protein [Jiella sp. LLJ827]
MRVGLALAAATVLAGCQAGPLYGTAGVYTFSTEPQSYGYEGRIAIPEPNSRTEQLLRNELLFRLNRGTPVTQPIYELRLALDSQARGLIADTGDIPRSAIFVEKARFTLVRLSDNQVVLSGDRMATVPYDSTEQLYQNQRALLDARKQTSRLLASQIELAVNAALSGGA